MNNVTISNKDLVSGDTPINLTNGKLVLHCNKNGEVINAYMVTSFRDHNRSLKNVDHAMNYCSLVNLDSGYLAFEERCSRRTSVARVLSHLNPNDFEAKRALADGQYIEVYSVGEFKIDLQLRRKKEVM